MSTQTGTITLAHGKIYIIDENGNTKEASVGDKVSLNDLIKTLDGSKLNIELLNGKVISFSGMKEVLIDESVVGDRVFADEEVDGTQIDEMFLANDDSIQTSQDSSFDENNFETAAGRTGMRLNVPKYISSSDISESFEQRDEMIDSLSQEVSTFAEEIIAPSSFGEAEQSELATIYAKELQEQLQEKIDNTPTIVVDTLLPEDDVVNVLINMPANAVVGDTLVITNPDGSTTELLITQDMIDNGYTLTYDKPADGGTLTVSTSVINQAGEEIGNSSVNVDTTVNDSTSTTPDDSTAPSVVIADDNTSDANTVSVTITLPQSAEVGDTLNITNPDGTIDSVAITQDMIDNGYTLTYDKPADGEELSVSASVTDADGNVSESGSDTTSSNDSIPSDEPNSSDEPTQTVTTHEIGTPTITIIEDFNSDGVINKSEKSGDVNIAIEVTDGVVAGDTLNIVNNGQTSTIEVTQTMVDNGVCNTALPMPNEGETFSVSAYFSDADGNSSASASASAVVDTIAGDGDEPLSAPAITISEDQNSDETINASEQNGDVNFSVSLSSDVPVGATLNLVVNGVPTSVVVTQDMIDARAYSTTALAPDEGDTLEIRASITDLDGNKTAESSNSVEIDTIYGDVGDSSAYVNMSLTDDNGVTTITGSLGESAESLDTLRITDQNGNVVEVESVTLQSDGTFSVDVDISRLVDGKVSVTLNATDDEGNTTELSDVSNKGIPSTPIVVVTDDMNDDNVINEDEFDGTLNVKISFDEDISAGYILNIDNNGTQESVEITQDMVNYGYYSFTTDSPADGSDYVVSATITDTNSKESESSSYSVNIDTTYGDDTSSDAGDDITPASTVLLDESGDNVINKSELATSDIKGTIGEGAATLDSLVVSDEAGHKITIDVSEVTLADDGSYKVQNIDLTMLDDGVLTLTAKSTDNDGNKATVTSSLTLDTSYGDDTNEDGVIEAAQVLMSEASGDGIVNSDESFITTISGTIGEGASSLDSIVVTDGAGHSINVDLGGVTLESGVYSIEDVDISSLDDGVLTITASSTDEDGNTLLVTNTINKDTVVGNNADGSVVQAPEVTITEDKNNDGVVNSDESLAKVDVSVAIENGISEGDLLHLDINGALSDVTITQSMVDTGVYKFEVTSPDEGEELVVSAFITDKDGNETEVASDSIVIDTTYGDDGSDAGSGITPASIEFIDESGDGKVNASEVKTTTLSGTIGEGAATLDSLVISDESGHKVVIDVKTVALEDDGSYVIENVNLSSLFDGELTVTAESTDNDGNRATVSNTITLDTTYGNDVNGDGSVESASVDMTKPTDGDDSIVEHISGTIGEAGSSLDSLIIVDINGEELSIDLGDVTQNSDGTYFIENVDVSSLADGRLTIYATSTDEDGNTTTVSEYETKNLPSNPIIEVLDDVNSDGTLNENEVDDKVNVKITFKDDIKVDDVLKIVDPDGSDNELKITQDMLDNGYEFSYTTPAEGESLTISATITNEKDLESEVEELSINIDTIYGDDTNADGEIAEAFVILTDNNGDDVINVAGTTANTISGSIGEGGATLQSLVISDKEGNELSLDVSKIGVNEDGTYSVENVDLSSFVDGNLTITASSLDKDANAKTVTDTIEKDIVYGDESDDNNNDITPASVTIVDSSEDGTITGTELSNSKITGTIGEGGKTLDSLIVSDENGNSVEVTDITLNADGTFSATNFNLESLNDGELTVTLHSTDLDGNIATPTATIYKDASYGNDGDDEGTDVTDASVALLDASGDGVANASEGTLTISGTIGEGADTLDTLVVTDSAGEKITLDVSQISIDEDGNYTTTVDISSLADGELTVSAKSTDLDGNEALRSGVILKDTVYSAGESVVSVDIVDESQNGLIIDKEVATSTINGDVGSGVEAIYSLIIIDTENNKVTIDPETIVIKDDGAFSVANVDLSTLSDGKLTVIANYIDDVGNKITKTDIIEKDATYGEDGDDEGVDVTPAVVMIQNDDGYDIINESGLKDSDISGTIGEGGETLESLTIVDESGNEVRIDLDDVTINEDGSYFINNVDLSELEDGILTLTAISTDIEGNTATRVDIINKDTVYGDDKGDDDYLIDPATLDIKDASGNEIVDSVEVLSTTIKGSIGEGADTLDSLVITDEAGHKVVVDISTVAIERSDVDHLGEYSINVDLSALDDGLLTITAKSTDLDGNKIELTDTITKDVVYGDDGDDEGEDITPVALNITDKDDDVINENELSTNKITGHIGEGAASLDSLVVSDEEGNEVVIEVANVSMADDGSYSVSGVDLSSLNDGTLTITAHSTDLDGNRAVITDTIIKDTLYGNDTDGDGEVVPVSVTFVDESQNGVLTGETLELADIHGTIGEGGETLESLVVTDANGHTKSLNVEDVVIKADGTYSVTNVDLSSLDDGVLTLSAHSIDEDGNATTTTTTIVKDTKYGNDVNEDGSVTPATLFVEDEGGDNVVNSKELSSVTINGTLGEGGASLDSLILRDSAGEEIVLDVESVTIKEDGSYSVENIDISSLKDGDITVSASLTDIDGNTTTKTDVINKDTKYGDDIDGDGVADVVQVTLSDESGDNIVNMHELVSNKITGFIGEGGASLDSLTITDSNGKEIIIDIEDVAFNADENTYSVSNLDLSKLADGTLTVSATSTDIDGNTITKVDTIEKDTSYGDDKDGDGVIIPADVDISKPSNDSLDLSGTIGEKGETLNSLVIVDEDGNSLTFDTADIDVDNDGVYKVLNIDVSSLADGALKVIAISTDIDGNTATVEDVEYKNIPSPATIEILEDVNNDGTINENELSETLNAKFTFAEDAEVGDTLKITHPNGDMQELDITQDMLDNGYIVTYETPAEGEDLTISSSIVHNGKESRVSSDTVNIDTIAGEKADGEITPPVITVVNDANSDNTINESEYADQTELRISIEDGVVVDDILHVIVNGKVIEVDVDNEMIEDGFHTLFVDTPAEGENLEVSANYTDQEGNTTETTTVIANIDTIVGEKEDGSPISAPVVTITEDVNDDGVINALEQEGEVNIAISLEEGIVAGDTINLTVNGETSTIEVTQEMLDSGVCETTATMPEEAGTIEVSAYYTDQEGNVSESGSDSAVVDTIYGDDGDDEGEDITDASTNITDANDDNLIVQSETSANTISGTIGEGGVSLDSLVIVDSEGNEVAVDMASVTLNEDNTYTVENIDLSSLADGELTLKATSTDLDGNIAVREDTITKDTGYGNDTDGDGVITPPEVFIVDENGDNIVNASEAASNKISGSIGEGGVSLDSLVIRDSDGNEIVIDVSQVTINEDNTYVVENVDLSTLVDGDITLSATSTDEDENSITVQSATLKDSVVNVSINAIVETADNTPTLKGSVDSDVAELKVDLINENGEVAQTFTLSDGNIIVDENGEWRLDWSQKGDDDKLSDGEYNIEVSATDIAGNTTTIQEENGFKVDGGAIVEITSISEDANVNGDFITNDNTLTISGTVDDAASVKSLEVTIASNTYDLNSDELSIENGVWTLDISALALEDKEYEVKVDYIDNSNNMASTTQVVTIDSNEPLTLDKFTYDDEDATTNDSNIKFTGTIENATAVSIIVTNSAGEESTLEVTMNEDGTFEAVSEKLKEGDYSVTVVATDLAGNESVVTKDFSVDFGVITLSVDDNADNLNDGIINTSSVSPILSGSVINSTDVSVAIKDSDGNIVWSGRVDTDDIDTLNNSWTLNVSDELAEGNYTLEVTATKDGADDVIVTSTLVIDTTAPDELTIESIDGVSTVDGTVETNNSNIKLEGNASSDVVKIIVAVDGHEFEANITENGWEATISEDYLLADGTYDIVVKGYDSAGNETSSSQSFTLDTTPPVITMNDVADDDDQTPTFSGTLSDDTVKVMLYIDGEEYEAVIDGDEWICSVPSSNFLTEGSYDVTAVAYDKLGNSVAVNDSFKVTVQALPEVEITTNILATADTTPTLEGTTLNAESLTIIVNDKEYDVAIDEDGSWNFSIPDALENGSYTLVAKVVDSDGHFATTSQNFAIDTTAVYNDENVIDGQHLYMKESIATEGQKVVQIALDENGSNATTITGDVFTTTLGGTIILNSDGTFSYTAPIIHNDGDDQLQDTFYYKESDGASESEWKEFIINVSNAQPDAQNDAMEVGYGAEVGGSLLDNDLLLVDNPPKMIKVTYDGADYEFGDKTSITIDAAHGELVINKYGEYTYTSTEEVKMVSNMVGDESSDDDADTFGSVVDITLNGFADTADYINSDGTLNLDASPTAALGISEDATIGAGVNNDDDAVFGEDDDTLVNGTEGMLVDMKESVDGLRLTFDTLDSGEQAKVILFDENGAVVKEIVVDGDDNGASMEIQRIEFRYVSISSESGDAFSVTEIAYTPKATEVDTFTYTLEDSDGDQSSADLVVSHTNLIELHSDSATVSEAGLEDGSLVGTGVESASGNLFSNDAGLYESDRVATITFEGQEYSTNEDGVIIIENATGRLEVNVDGSYSYTLLSSTTDGSEGSVAFDYTLEHGESSTLVVNIQDDAVRLTSENESVSLVSSSNEPQSYNITLVIDKSGSMVLESEDSDGTRMDATKDAITELLDQYSKLGEVNINIIDFSETLESSEWMMNDENSARDYISFIEADGEASYEDVIAKLNSLDVPEADNNVLYVLTDNSEWTTDNTELNDAIAHVVGEEGSSHIVTSTVDVKETLLSTIESERSISGDLASNSDMQTLFNFGVDGGYIQTVVVDGTQYNYSASTEANSLDPENPYIGDKTSITTSNGGTLIIDFKTGEYTYIADASQDVQASEVITLIGVDGDGDSVESQLIINVDTSAIKDASRDSVITNRVDSSFEISAAALLANDNSGTIIDGFNDVKTVDMELEWDESGMFAIEPTKDLDAEVMSFEYSTADGQNVAVDVSRVDSNTLSGSEQSEIFLANDSDTIVEAEGGDDVLTGGAGDDTLNAGAGDDTVDGGAGNDTIDGGEGNDIINGGTGNDTIVAGAGNDFIDGGEGSDVIDAGAGNDTIIYGAGDVIDGGENNDTLIVHSDIDFTNLDTIRNIENIDIDSEDVKLTLDLDSVISMTDEENMLNIFGDDNDSVELDGNWTYSGQEYNEQKETTVDVYEQDGSIVKIDHEIDVSIIS